MRDKITNFGEGRINIGISKMKQIKFQDKRINKNMIINLKIMIYV